MGTGPQVLRDQIQPGLDFGHSQNQSPVLNAVLAWIGPAFGQAEKKILKIKDFMKDFM